jgi:leucyl/phenylalanyl-tRNA--protein transferase
MAVSWASEERVPPAESPFARPWPAGEDIVAVGGRLEAALVLDAYRHGVFPFYDEAHPVLWWCPDPRAVLPLDGLHVPRRLRRTLGDPAWEITVDTDFEAVMRACDEHRADGTWIHEDMVRCYVALHAAGHAHSLEVRREGRLVGGLYGVAVGGVFSAESKFHRARDASKVALVHLARRLAERGFAVLDVQFLTPHLERFGCVEIARDEYLARVREAVKRDTVFR